MAEVGLEDQGSFADHRAQQPQVPGDPAIRHRDRGLAEQTRGDDLVLHRHAVRVGIEQPGALVMQHPRQAQAQLGVRLEHVEAVRGPQRVRALEHLLGSSACEG